MNTDIIRNAELVIRKFQELTKFNFGYNLESVEWVDDYLTRIRRSDEFNEDLKIGLVNTIGSFLGQCIIQLYGGEWGRNNGSMGVKFNADNWAFPFAKVEKHLANGAEDSIYAFFTCIPAVFDDRLTRSTKKPWWKIW